MKIWLSASVLSSVLPAAVVSRLVRIAVDQDLDVAALHERDRAAIQDHDEREDHDP